MLPTRQQRVCAFCFKLGNASKEHLWPEWSHDILPDAPRKIEFIKHGKAFVFDESQAQIYNRQGSPKTFRARVVCRSCNNGWMNEIEGEFQPIFRSLYSDTSTSITSEQAKSIAQWLFLKFTVTAIFSQKVPCVEEEDRRAFYETRIIPDKFRLWVSVHHDKFWKSAVRIFSYQLSSSMFRRVDGGIHNLNN